MNIAVGNFVLAVTGADLQHACEAFRAVASVKAVKDKCRGEEPDEGGEGQTIIVECRWGAGREARLRELAAVLVQRPVDRGGHHAVYALQRL
jgi:hypothetical protein